MNTIINSEFERTDSDSLIRYPHYLDLQARIYQCQEMAQMTNEPRCIAIEGKPGTGKTTLVQDYASKFAPQETPDGPKTPVLYISVPFPGTIKWLVSTMLDALGDTTKPTAQPTCNE